ncbi:hypothetical protein TNCV_1188471 [Trichonephila clavipes]|nr:hypothetical protein TNCV_1188471 [Trichonephila clavipes]
MITDWRQSVHEVTPLSEFERGRIIGMIEAGWSARRVVRQRQTGHPQQTSNREGLYIIRHAHVEPTASLADVQTQAAPSLWASASSAWLKDI